MAGFINRIIGDKKEWTEMEARAKALPEDYQIVYGAVKNYIWKSSGLGAIDVHKGVLGLFEESATNDEGVLAVTGDDVAGFCDELLRGAETYSEGWRKDLNKEVADKLKK